MNKKPKDWFGVQHQFNVTTPQELQEFLDAVSFLIATQNEDEDFDFLNDNLDLGRDMLENIGVKCNATSR